MLLSTAGWVDEWGVVMIFNHGNSLNLQKNQPFLPLVPLVRLDRLVRVDLVVQEAQVARDHRRGPSLLCHRRHL